MANTPNKNLLPSFAQGSYQNILRLISDENVNAPAFIYFTDRECLGFLDSKNVLHTILWERVTNIEEQLDGLNDPETGHPVSVAEYIQPTIEAVEEIQKNGATILITSDGGEE